jgi:hypothetical protein
VDAGPQFPIVSSRLDARIFSLREGEALPAEAVSLIKGQSQSLAEPLRVALVGRGFLGAMMSDEQVGELERILTTTPALLAPAPALKPAPRSATKDGEGVSVIGGGRPSAAPTPPPEPVFGPAPKGAPVNNLASVTVRPGAVWTPLLDAPPRTEPWALALDQSVASLKPGTLRCFVRAWPAPAEPVPTAGMAGELRVQLLPMVAGVLHEAAPDPLAPRPPSTDLSAHGQVLGRQSFTASLRSGSSLVLIALPVNDSPSTPGPQADSAPMLGQALLGAGPALSPTGRPTGPRVLVLRPVIPGTYRLLLDRGAPVR